MARMEEAIGIPLNFLPSPVLSDVWPFSQEDLPICGRQSSTTVAMHSRQSAFWKRCWLASVHGQVTLPGWARGDMVGEHIS